MAVLWKTRIRDVYENLETEFYRIGSLCGGRFMETPKKRPLMEPLFWCYAFCQSTFSVIPAALRVVKTGQR